MEQAYVYQGRERLFCLLLLWKETCIHFSGKVLLVVTLPAGCSSSGASLEFLWKDQRLTLWSQLVGGTEYIRRAARAAFAFG